MIIRLIFAEFHLPALGLGLGLIWSRSRALTGTLDSAVLKLLFVADNWWGFAAGIWVGTGLVRLLSPLEKGRDYYFANEFFRAKMLAFVLILLLEIRPMITFIKWRSMLRRGLTPNTSVASLFAKTSALQTVLVVVMVLAASAMAR